MIYLTYFVFYSDKFYINHAVHSQLRVIVHNFTAIF